MKNQRKFKSQKNVIQDISENSNAREMMKKININRNSSKLSGKREGASRISILLVLVVQEK
jgi:hypothetical protein